MAQTQLTKTRLVDLSGSVIPRTNLSHANLIGANLSGANLSGANLGMALLIGANMANSILRGAELFQADLAGADLTRADLTGANLSGANLTSADLGLANLERADMRGANLGDARNLDWFSLLNARIDEHTQLPEYLDEAGLLDELEQLFPGEDWRKKFGGHQSDLLHYLNELWEKVGDQTLRQSLMALRVHQEQSSDE